MSTFWEQLNARQRVLIVLAGLVLVAAALFVGVWEPLAESRAAERERVAGQQALLDWLDAVAPVAAELRRRGDRGRDRGGRSLLGLADETARAAGLAGALSRIEPAGDDRVRVWLEGAEFLATMGWLEQLAVGHPVVVDQLDVDRGRSSGLVNVRVTLASEG
ncbi:MAG: type II secretion system protein M [Wenzhouxiangella sp.]|nr:MAG: type II secretion system protein M [Wenzhouxiangella sp.]